jgi:hypothetical protein
MSAEARRAKEDQLINPAEAGSGYRQATAGLSTCPDCHIRLSGPIDEAWDQLMFRHYCPPEDSVASLASLHAFVNRHRDETVEIRSFAETNLQGSARKSTVSPSGLLDRCMLGVDELPAPVPPNEHVGRALLLIYRPLLVLSFGGAAIGHDGGIPVEVDLDLLRAPRLVIHAAGLAVLQVLRPVLDGAARAVVDVVLVQDALQESDIRVDDGPIEGP